MAKTKLKIWPGGRQWGFLFLVALMIGLIEPISNFLINRFEVAVQAMVIPLAATAIVAALIASLFWRLYRRNPLAGFTAVLVAAGLLTNNYDARLAAIYPIFTAILPLPALGNIEPVIFSLIFIVFIFGLAGLAGRLLSHWVDQKGWSAADIIGGTAIALAVIFGLLSAPAAKTIVASWPQYFYKPPAHRSSAKAGGPKPDIYYIVTEDYANQTQLKQQFNFDNASFMNYLSTNGYFVNPNAHQNYPYTTMSLASTLNAGYNSDIIKRFGAAKSQNILPYHRAVQFSSVAAALKDLGYRYDEIGTWYETTNRGPIADNFYLNDRRLTLFGRTVFIDGFTQNQLAAGPFWRFLTNGVNIGHWTLLRYQGEDQVHLTTDELNQLKNLTNQPAGGRFIFAHIIGPHQPYYFNADGSISATPNNDNSGQTIKAKYVGQLEYLNQQLEQILTNIKNRSGGQAVVILQSDEGPHPQELNEQIFDQDSANDEINSQDMRLLSDSDLALKYGAMTAYNIPAATPADLAVAANHVNVFRLVLNAYFGANLSYLPECYYAFPNGRNQPFNYEDVTSRVAGAPNPVCASDGTGPK